MDRQTDGWTESVLIARPRLCYMQRGKNQQNCILFQTSDACMSVIKLLSKRCGIPNLLVEGGLSHERPS